MKSNLKELAANALLCGLAAILVPFLAVAGAGALFGYAVLLLAALVIGLPIAAAVLLYNETRHWWRS